MMAQSDQILLAVLSIVQLFLLMFIFGLAREVFVLKTQRQTDESWPLVALSPGDVLPETLRRASFTMSLDSGSSAMILCAITDEGLRQLVVSALAACRIWGKDLLLISETEALASFCAGLESSLQVLSVIPGLSRELGLSSNALLFTQNGRVVEASTLSQTPSAIQSRFGFVAE